MRFNGWPSSEREATTALAKGRIADRTRQTDFPFDLGDILPRRIGLSATRRLQWMSTQKSQGCRKTGPRENHPHSNHYFDRRQARMHFAGRAACAMRRKRPKRRKLNLSGLQSAARSCAGALNPSSLWSLLALWSLTAHPVARFLPDAAWGHRQPG